jgi:Tol biopolymer transport system component
MHTFFSVLAVLVLTWTAPVQDGILAPSHEPHLRNIVQLTRGGTNAEAYFSFDESHLIFQSTRPPFKCDQIFIMPLSGRNQRLVSTGAGRTTCGYFLPGDQSILYASTHGASEACPPPPDKSRGYVWGVFNAYDIYVADRDGSNPRLLAGSAGYDAEATVSPTGDRIVFTSSRDGDLELYTMNTDGSDIRRLTTMTGYDGGANFSWDGNSIVFRGYHPTDPAELEEYRNLLAEELVKPGKMEIFLCNADGSNLRQITSNGAANFAPVFHPDNRRIVFSSNMEDPAGRVFHLYVIGQDGTGLKRITSNGNFNAFPMFTRDGKRLVFVSDRHAQSRYEFNVYLSDWVED